MPAPPCATRSIPRRPAGIAVLALAVLTACSMRRYTPHSPHTAAARAWVQATATTEPPGRALVAGARVLGLGEASHGALDVFLARADLTTRLISDGWARTLVLEADAWDVCALDRYVHGDGDDLRGALRATIGLYMHDDSERFFRWLRTHNQGTGDPVDIRGMDARSLESCQADDIAACPGRAKYCRQARDLRRAPNLGETYFGRDELMAANVLEFAAASPGGVVVWAHAGHVSRSPPLLFNGRWSQTAPMGWFLARALGAAYRPMTVTFRRGTISTTARHGGLMWPRFGELADVPLPDAPPGTLEGLVAHDAAPVLLDLRTLPMFADATAWFAAPRFIRSIGAADRMRWLERSTLATGWGHYIPREAFDVVLVLPDTRPTRPWFAAAPQ